LDAAHSAIIIMNLEKVRENVTSPSSSTGKLRPRLRKGMATQVFTVFFDRHVHVLCCGDPAT